MKLKTALLAMVLFLMAACDNTTENSLKEPDSSQEEQAVEREINTEEEQYVFKLGEGVEIKVLEDKTSASISYLTIVPDGFENSNDIIRIGETDPVSEVFLEDLNNDGFKEIYIITTGAGSGSYGTVYGAVSNADKSLTPVYVRKVEESDIGGEWLDGYRGHDRFYIDGNLLVREFPLYSDDDSNAAPEGGKAKVYYTLKQGEAGWMLEPVQKKIEK